MAGITIFPGSKERSLRVTAEKMADAMAKHGVPSEVGKRVAKQCLIELDRFSEELRRSPIRIVSPRPPANETEDEYGKAHAQIAVNLMGDIAGSAFLRTRLRTELKAMGYNFDWVLDSIKL